jgi:hypothetical protein
MKMVPATPTIDEVHISSFVSPRVSRISERRGAMANQMKKAIKNDHLRKKEKSAVRRCFLSRRVYD